MDGQYFVKRGGEKSSLGPRCPQGEAEFSSRLSTHAELSDWPAELRSASTAMRMANKEHLVLLKQVFFFGVMRSDVRSPNELSAE